MLRISAASDEVPQEVLRSVKELYERSGRHIRRVRLAASGTRQTAADAGDVEMRPVHHTVPVKRYSQAYHFFDSFFVGKCHQRQPLHDMLSDSVQLPEFVLALEKYEADQRRAPSRSPVLLPSSPPLKPYTPEPSSSRASPIPSKLRYAAYEPPRPTQRLRRTSSSSSRHSDDGGSRRSYQEPMSMTVTAGDLTIAAQTSDLSSIPSVSGCSVVVPRESLSTLSRVLLARQGYPPSLSCRSWTKSPQYVFTLM